MPQSLPRIALAALLYLTAMPAFAGAAGSNGQSGVEPTKLTEYAGLNTRNTGPDAATGVIYFIDGLDPAQRTPDEFSVTYPYVYDLNRKFGWDVINAKYPNSRNDIANSVPSSAAYVYDRVKALKAKGYKRVVLAGQSWGGWVSLQVASRDAATHLIDTLMMVAPAAYGAKSWEGRDNPYYLQNLTEYVRAIKTVRTPTVAVFFRGDDFDPGDRGAVTDAFYARNRTPLLLIDQPDDFLGHGAGWLPPFSDRYGTCIGEFLKAPMDKRCASAETADRSKGLLPQEAQIVQDKRVELADEHALAGKTFILTSPSIEVRALTFRNTTVEIAAADGLFDTDLMQKGTETCVGDECYRVYRTPDGRYLAFERDGAFAGWLAPVK